MPTNSWKGQEYKLPLNESMVCLPLSVFRFGSQSFEPVGTGTLFETNIGFPLPEWRLLVSNQITYILSEGDNIVDFVLLHDLGTYANIDGELMNPTYPVLGWNGIQEDSRVKELWNTNRLVAGNILCPTDGIVRQISVSLGNVVVSATAWNDYLDERWRGVDKLSAINSLRRFMGYGAIGGSGTSTIGATSLRLTTPFCPSRKFLRTCTWQVNDPLVHYHVGDMVIVDPTYPFTSNVLTEAVVPALTGVIPTNMTLATLGQLNRPYAPWGGNPEKNSDPLNPTDPNGWNPAIKDPGVYSADNWDFPVGQSLDLSWLGRVHRGSPWQTIYLKSGVADGWAWRQQSSGWSGSAGNADPNSSFLLTHPTNDWALARILASLINTNPPQRLVSINDAHSADWAAVWDGINVLTNNLSDEEVCFNPNPQCAIFVMASHSPQAATLSDAINRARAFRPNGRFHDLTDFLTVPELSVASPWLNQNPIQTQFGLTDQALEAIPQQVLSRLRGEDIECGLSRTKDRLILELRVPWPDLSCEVQTSTDLQTWTSASGSLLASNGVVRLEWPGPTNGAHCFYRGRLLP